VTQCFSRKRTDARLEIGVVQKRRCAWAKRVQVRCSEEKCAYTRCTQANLRTCRCARLHPEINTIAVSRLAPAGRIAEGGSWRTGRIRDIRPEHVVTVGVGQAFEAGTLILMRLNSEDDRLLLRKLLRQCSLQTHLERTSTDTAKASYT